MKRLLFIPAILLMLGSCGDSEGTKSDGESEREKLQQEYESVQMEYDLKTEQRDLAAEDVQNQFNRLIKLDAADFPKDDAYYIEMTESLEELKTRQAEIQAESDSLLNLMTEISKKIGGEINKELEEMK